MAFSTKKVSPPGSQDLYVAPEREVQRDCDVVVAFGDLAFDCQGQFLQANSGYFAAAMRHEWSDGLGEGKEGSRVYRFQDFPGDRPAFSLAMSWFACPRGLPIFGARSIYGLLKGCYILFHLYVEGCRILRSIFSIYIYIYTIGPIEATRLLNKAPMPLLGRRWAPLASEHLARLLLGLRRRRLPGFLGLAPGGCQIFPACCWAKL